MSEDKKSYDSLRGRVEPIKAFLRYIWKKKIWILIAAIAGIGIGFLFYSLQKPKYQAICTFVLEEKQSGMGGLSGIASQFGFDMGSLTSGGSIFSGDNILDILKSKLIVQKVLLSRYIDSTGSPTLADIYLDFSGLKKKWETKPALATISFVNVTDRDRVTELQDSVLNIVYKNVLSKNLSTDRLNKKGSIIRVQVTASNSLFAKLMTDRLVEEASTLYLNIKTGTAEANIARMQRRSDSLLALLNSRSYAAAATQQLDVNPGLKSIVVPSEIAVRDKTVIATLYTEITKNLEASKLILAQQTPVIQLLDRPGPSLDDNKRSLLAFVIGAAFLFGFLGILTVASVYFLKALFGSY